MPSWSEEFGNGKLPEILSEEEIDEFLEVVEIYEPRVWMAFRMMYLTGMRSFELMKIRPTNVDLKMCTIKICQGKGGKDRLVPITKNYLQGLTQFTPKDPTIPYFPIPTGTQRWLCRKYRKLTSFPEKNLPHPHTLRHCFAVRFLRRCNAQNIIYGLSILQRIMGHKKLSTTAIYLQFQTEDVIEVYKTVFPE